MAPPQPGVQPGHLTGHEQARGWFEAERSVILALVAQAADAGFDRHAWQLPWALADFLHQQGHWHDWAAGQARAHQYLGYASARLGHYDDGHRHLEQALAMFRGLGRPGDEAHVLLTLAVISGYQDRHDEALSHARLALATYQAAGHRAGEANALNAVGWSQAMLGRHAVACYQQADGNWPAAREAWQQAVTIFDKLRHPDAAGLRTRLERLG